MTRGSKLLIMTFLVLAVVAMIGADLLAAAAPIQFSADMVQIDKKSKETIGKYFFGGDKLRNEVPGENSTWMISIIRLDKNLVWVILPEQDGQKFYYEYDLTKKMPWLKQTDDLIKKKTDLGVETVNGYVCHKWEYVYKNILVGTMYYWVSDRLGANIKWMDKDKNVTEMRNIKEGKQPASLFEVPEGYQKQSVTNMFNNIFGGGGSGSGS